MRLSSIVIAIAFLAVTWSVRAAPLPGPQAIEIPSGTAVLHAQLYKPEGDGRAEIGLGMVQQ